MSVFVNDGGVEKEAKMIYVNDGGIDKLVAGGNTLIIGAPFEGGFLAAIEVISGATFAYIVADKSAETRLEIKSPSSATPDTYSLSDGWANTIAMYDSPQTHPAAEYCRAYRGGGFDDWFLGSINEMREFIYKNLAPHGANTPSPFKNGEDQAFIGPNTNETNSYFSSTSSTDNTSQSLRVSFFNGFTGATGKASERNIRPIRKVQIS